jgi:hypothetical protein
VARIIIVGDVHGCSRELAELVDRLGPADGDRFFFVGDLVGRGPDSPGVLSIVRAVGGRSVLGNHERKLLQARAACATEADRSRLSAMRRQLLQELSEEDWAQLETMPAYLELSNQQLGVVHAGVLPGVRITDQDEAILTTLRSLRSDGSPSDRLDGRPWAALYHGPPHWVFGHNAPARVQLWADATGLDSGCVYGGELTALVLEAGQLPPAPAERRELLLSVAAHRCYFTPGGERAP